MHFLTLINLSSLDFYLLSKCNYWHNLREKRKPGYHKEKEEIFAKKGIRIYYIWDYEWFEDKDHIIISEFCKERVKNIIFN